MNRWFATTDEKAFFRRVSYTRLWPFLQLRCSWICGAHGMRNELYLSSGNALLLRKRHGL